MEIKTRNKGPNGAGVLFYASNAPLLVCTTCPMRRGTKPFGEDRRCTAGSEFCRADKRIRPSFFLET